MIPKEIRVKLQKNKVPIGAACGVIVFAAIVKMAIGNGTPPAAKPLVSPVYYYDLASGELFAGPSDDFPPIAAPSNKKNKTDYAGVRAYIFACGRCSDATSKLAYVEKYNTEAQIYMREAMKDQEARIGPIIEHVNAIRMGHVVAQPVAGKDVQWSEAKSDEGIAMIESFLKDCPPTEPATECRPN